MRLEHLLSGVLDAVRSYDWNRDGLVLASPRGLPVFCSVYPIPALAAGRDSPIAQLVRAPH